MGKPKIWNISKTSVCKAKRTKIWNLQLMFEGSWVTGCLLALNLWGGLILS